MRNHLFDGDFMLVTDSYEFVECAFDNFLNTNVPVNETPKAGSNNYSFTPSSVARLDNIIASMQKVIGMSSNCAVNALSIWWTTGDRKMWEIAIIQAINAQNAIDSAKRLFDVNIEKENTRLCKLVDKCNWFCNIKHKNSKFDSVCAMDTLLAESYRIPNQVRELSIMTKLVDSNNNYNIQLFKNLDELNSLVRAYHTDHLDIKVDRSVVDRDEYEIILEIKHFRLRHNYEWASLFRTLYEGHSELGFATIINWMRLSGCNISSMFNKEYEAKTCIICGKEFTSSNRTKRLCGDPNCRREWNKIEIRRRRNNKNDD